MEMILNILSMAPEIITLASIIVAITKTETDNLWLAKILKYVMPVVDFLSMSKMGHAKK
jgi:hypothetical protein